MFIPLYLQVVDGASPTSSGLMLLPLMIGLLTASIGSGADHLPHRPLPGVPDRRHRHPHRRHAAALRPRRHTSRLVSSLYMVVIGLGIGLVMQVIIIAVQNDADPRNMGATTSTATFFRSIGGSFGVAILGSIFATRLAHELAKLPGGTHKRASAAASGSVPSRSATCPQHPRAVPPPLLERALRRLPVGRDLHVDRLRPHLVPAREAAERDPAGLEPVEDVAVLRGGQGGEAAAGALHHRPLPAGSRMTETACLPGDWPLGHPRPAGGLRRREIPAESGRRVSNPRPRAWEARALPTELRPRGAQSSGGRAGFDPDPRASATLVYP